MPLIDPSGVPPHGSARTVLRVYPDLSGTLRLIGADGATCVVELRPRETIVLLALVLAYQRDPMGAEELELELAEDYRRGRVIGKQLAELNDEVRAALLPGAPRRDPSVDRSQAMRTYVSGLKRRIADAVEERLAEGYDLRGHEVLSSDRGYRIGREGLVLRGLLTIIGKQ